jgi:hypothetical protein
VEGGINGAHGGAVCHDKALPRLWRESRGGIPHTKGAEETLGIRCLDETGCAVRAVTDELAAQILCNFTFIRALEAVEHVVFKLLQHCQRWAANQAVVHMGTDINICCVSVIRCAFPHRLLKSNVGEAHTLEVTVEGLVESSRGARHAVKWAQDFVDHVFVLIVWGARRGANEEPTIDTFGKAVCLNESLSEVAAVELPILRSGKRDHHARRSRPWCGTECIIVVNILLHTKTLYDEACFEA